MTTTIGSLDLGALSDLREDVTQYFWFESDSTSAWGSGAHVTLYPESQFTDSNNANYLKGQNILMNTDGFSIRNGVLPMMVLGNDSLDFNVIDTTNNTYTNQASFGAISTIGVTDNTQSYMQLDYHSLQMKDKEGDYYLYISDRRGKNGSATLEVNFLGDGETTQFDVGVYITTLDSAVDSSNPSNVATVSTTNSRYVIFSTAPANGAQVTIVFTTTDQGAKAYTLGTRDTTNDVLGASSVVLNRLNVASGPDSCASGYHTVASGNNAHSEGLRTTASGACSHAEGGRFNNNGTMIYNTASGTASHAEGAGTTASEICSHAEGYSTTASGDDSHAEGYSTTASGNYSHAEGFHTTASEICSHAEGYGTTASGTYSHTEGIRTTASGANSHAEGGVLNNNGTMIYNTASGNASHAEGAGTTASGNASHAEGVGTTASGNASHAEGNSTIASGTCSHAEGIRTTAQRKSQTAIGEFNIADTGGTDSTTRGDYAFIVGNGTSNTARSNALTVAWDSTVAFADPSKTFIVEEYTKSYSAISSGSAFNWSEQKSKSGYYPIGVVGFRTNMQALVVNMVKLSSVQSGQCTINMNARAVANVPAGTAQMYVLWIKET